jgi:hypothetical protein
MSTESSPNSKNDNFTILVFKIHSFNIVQTAKGYLLIGVNG